VYVPLDTTPEAAELQIRAYREMSLAGRLRIALELSDLTHSLAVAGTRRLNPELSDEDARRMLAERLYGRDTVTQR
jgi:hypothetical protein